MKLKRRFLKPLILLYLSGLVYVCSLTLVSVDKGETAPTASDRLDHDQVIQPSPSLYQGTLGLPLQLAPYLEQLIRSIPLFITSLAAGVSGLLCLALMFQGRWNRRALAALVVILAAVEPLSLSLPAAAGAQEFFVAPDGAPGGDGSQAAPWDLATALGGQRVPPGSTVWLRGGIYRGAFTSYLQGSSQLPITLRGYPGEWAVIDGNGFRSEPQNAVFTIYGQWARYWGFEVMSSNPVRGFPGRIFRQAGVDVQGPHTKLINLVIHDTGEGNGAWKDAFNAELYGNIIYNCGSQNTDADTRHGHSLYLQNDIGTKIIQDNILFNQFGWGIHAYGYPLKGLTIEGNIIFENGFWSETERHYNNILISGHEAERIAIANNYTYQCRIHRTAQVTGDANLSLGWNGAGYRDIVVKDNYFGGGSPPALIGDWQQMTMTGNTFVNHQAMFAVALSDGFQQRGHLWNHNTYSGQGGWFGLNGQVLDFAGWKSATGFDQGSQHRSGHPTGVRVFVRPNLYEPGRAHIVVYNWDLKDQVDVDVGAILENGDPYEVRNVQNYLGSPVLTGTYQGDPLSLPLAGLEVARPVGLEHGQPATGKEFNVFVLQRGTVLSEFPESKENRGRRRVKDSLRESIRTYRP